jgi:hypothetical protein
VGVTSIWFTRTTETWVRKRPRSGDSAAKAFDALPASASEAAAHVVELRNCRLVQGLFSDIRIFPVSRALQTKSYI